MAAPEMSDADDENLRARPRGKQPIDWTTNGEEPTGISDRDARRRAGREVADEASELAQKLIDLTDLAFAQLSLDEELHEAVRRTRAMRSDGGQRRTIRTLAGMLRQRDRRPLQAAFMRLEAGKGVEAARFQAWERWRDRLMADGDPALDALLAEFPGADRQNLRNLLRQARNEQETQKPSRAFRELFRALRALDEG